MRLNASHSTCPTDLQNHKVSKIDTVVKNGKDRAVTASALMLPNAICMGRGGPSVILLVPFLTPAMAIAFHTTYLNSHLISILFRRSATYVSVTVHTGFLYLKGLVIRGGKIYISPLRLPSPWIIWKGVF